MSLTHLATRDVISVAPADTLDKAISLMDEFRMHHLPVLADGRLVGIVSDRDLLLAVGWKLNAERRLPEQTYETVAGPQRIDQIMTHDVITVTPDHTPRQAARTMIDLKIGALPMVSDGRLIGIVTDVDLLREFQRSASVPGGAQTLAQQPVSAIMRTRLSKVHAESSLHEIISVLQDRHVRHAPVVADDGSLIGIVSDRDVRRALGLSSVTDMQAQETGHYYDEPQNAGKLMSRNVHTVRPTCSVGEATAIVLENKIHALPVVEREALLGIVTTTDILREAARQDLLA